MSEILNKIYTPKEIYVLWQNVSQDTRMPTGKKYPVGKLIYKNENLWNLEYLDIKTPLNFVGYLPYKFFPNKIYEDVKATFIKRLPPKTRTDFKEFLQGYKISEECIDINDFALLAYTEGNLPGDNFSFVNPLTEIPIGGEFIISIAGFRYYSGYKEQAELIHKKVIFQKEPDNQYDKEAVKIRLSDGTTIGYVSVIQNERINYLLDNKVKIDASIVSIRGSKEKPQVLVYVKTSL